MIEHTKIPTIEAQDILDFLTMELQIHEVICNAGDLLEVGNFTVSSDEDIDPADYIELSINEPVIVEKLIAENAVSYAEHARVKKDLTKSVEINRKCMSDLEKAYRLEEENAEMVLFLSAEVVTLKGLIAKPFWRKLWK